jgi:hypothetical protein
MEGDFSRKLGGRLFLFMPVVRCRNSKFKHNDSFGKYEDKGKILFILQDNSIYAKCSGTKNNCKRWTKVEINYPGIEDLDFSKAALTQTVMTKNFTFPLKGKDIEPAPILIED